MISKNRDRHSEVTVKNVPSDIYSDNNDALKYLILNVHLLEVDLWPSKIETREMFFYLAINIYSCSAELLIQ